MRIAVAVVADPETSAADSSIAKDTDEDAVREAMGNARRHFENEGGDDGSAHVEITFIIEVNDPVHQPIRLELHNGQMRLLSAKQN
jgi:hypothetical protein